MLALDVRNLHFHYGTSDGSLHDITFQVAPGESVALVGPNGAGKSTLLMHLNGLLPESLPAVPAVHVFGTAVSSASILDIRRRVGLVFQEPDDQLFCMTVYEDVAFGPEQLGLPSDKVRARVIDALARVGLPGFGARSPHRMSGGEKRRACIAGVLACEPQVMLLDEPSAGLDPRGRRQLIELLASLPMTRIIATHDLDLALDLCPRTLILDAGRLAHDGPTSQVLADAALMDLHGLEVPYRLRA